MGTRARSRRGPVSVLLAALFAGLLIGCGTPVPPTPTPEPVTIYFAFPADLDDYYDDLIEKFNDEHPEITVERRTVRTEDTWRYLFEKGEIDAFVFSGESQVLSILRTEDVILDLSPLIEGEALDLDDYYPNTLEPFTAEGSVWALPAGVNLAVLYYNKDLLDQYSVPYPEPGWTWDDMLRTAIEVRDLDADVYGLVAFPYFTIPMVYQHGGRLVDDWHMPARLTLDDPLTVEAVEWFASLTLDYDVMPSPERADQLFGQGGNASYIFWRRKAGMYMGWLSEQGGESWGPDARWQMEWGMVPLPRDETRATLGLVHAHGIASTTAHPDACWEWLMFLNEQHPPYTMPARRSLAESDAYLQGAGEEASAVALSSIEEVMVISGSGEGITFDLERYMQAIQEVLNGNVSAMEALSEMQREAESG